MSVPSMNERHELRRRRVNARMIELDRLRRHKDQQHAIALLVASGSRRAAARRRHAGERSWWSNQARLYLAKAAALR